MYVLLPLHRFKHVSYRNRCLISILFSRFPLSPSSRQCHYHIDVSHLATQSTEYIKLLVILFLAGS